MYTTWPTRKMDVKGRLMLPFDLPNTVYGHFEHVEEFNVNLLVLYNEQPLLREPDSRDLYKILYERHFYEMQFDKNKRIVLPKQFRAAIQPDVHYLLRPNSTTLVGRL